MPTDKTFEQHLRAKIEKQFDAQKATQLISAYENARSKLIDNIYAEIKGAEKDLSDHSDKHISNVLENACALLEEDCEPAESTSDSNTCIDLTGIEMYCLGMIILFHDVGNLFGREDHRSKVAEVYDWVRGKDASVRSEKTLVLSAVKTHTGKANDGTYDTLKDLGVSEHLERNKVQIRDLAAILRFADELAEGPQRTSEFMRTKGQYDEDSQIFHDYASITHVLIDRGNERIALKYEIDLPTNGTLDERRDSLKTLLKFVYERIVKLDQERRYATYYSSLLAPFRRTEVTFNFHHDGEILNVDLEPLQLTDKVIPGDRGNEIDSLDPAYTIESLVEKLIS